MIRRVIGKLTGCGNEAERAELDTLRREVRALRARLAELERAPVGAPVAVGSFAEAARTMAAGGQAQLGAVPAPPIPAAPSPTVEPEAAAGPRVVVELEDCIACGTCVEYGPSVFRLGPDGRAVVESSSAPVEEIEAAIQACPTQCIRWEPTA